MDSGMLKIIAAIIILIAAIIGRKKIFEHRGEEYHKQKRIEKEKKNKKENLQLIFGVPLVIIGLVLFGGVNGQLGFVLIMVGVVILFVL